MIKRSKAMLAALGTGLMRWVRSWRKAPPVALTDRQQAQALIAAIDRGGMPLNPAKVNHIARSLGLDVSSQAPMAHTITRIRQALSRLPD